MADPKATESVTETKAPEPVPETPAPAKAQDEPSTSAAAAATTATADATAATGDDAPNTSNLLPADHWTQNPLADDGDADSALGSDGESSTASITSSILHYRTIHGRSFHSEQGTANYWASNDETQSEVMDINHHTLTLGIGDVLYKSPLDKAKVKNVLDIGTGTGIWAIDFADQHPDAEVIGTDVSPIQSAWVPPNCRFEIEDCTRPWTFAAESQDFVHMRWLVGSIPDWNSLYAEAFRVCRPGAWFETLEPSAVIVSDDDTVPADSAMGQWGKLFIEGGKRIGNSFTVYEDEVPIKAMKAAGFEDIHVFEFKNPVGTWPKDPTLKEMGRFTAYNLEIDTEGFMIFMANVMGWSKEEIAVYIAHLRRDLRSGTMHGYYHQRLVWGRKPL